MVDLKCPDMPASPPLLPHTNWSETGIFWYLCILAVVFVSQSPGGKGFAIQHPALCWSLVTWPRLSKGKQFCLLRCRQAKPPAPEPVSLRVISLRSLQGLAMAEQDRICSSKWEPPQDKSSVDSAWSWVRLHVVAGRTNLCFQAQQCIAVSRGSFWEGLPSQYPAMCPASSHPRALMEASL